MGHADQLASCPTAEMSLSQMEERLRALAQQRADLLNGMRDKLPEKFDPFKFDDQGGRGLEPLDERRTFTEGTSALSEVPEVEAESSTSQQFRYSPNPRGSNARRTRLSGVDDIVKSAPNTLRGQAAMPKVRTTAESLQQGTVGVKTSSQVPVDRKIAPAKSSPRSNSSALSPRAKATSPVKASSAAAGASPDQLQSPRTSRPGANTNRQSGTGRQVSNSPSRSRAAMYGVGKDINASKERPASRQVSSSPSRNRSAAYGVGKDTDTVRDRRFGKGPLWR